MALTSSQIKLMLIGAKNRLTIGDKDVQNHMSTLNQCAHIFPLLFTKTPEDFVTAVETLNSNKTKRPQIIVLNNPECPKLLAAVKMLKAARKLRGEEYLFQKSLLCLANGNSPVPTCKWYNQQLGETLKKLFHKPDITMNTVRGSLGKFLTEWAGHSLSRQKKVEKRMDHSWTTHIKIYNRMTLEEKAADEALEAAEAADYAALDLD
ncbi:hypothetical protein HKX48_003277 [Thoreauomyces humboldtii]|nr:hypothetical protein HKX48_003277 [Thoreauomyces humboldtii]